MVTKAVRDRAEVIDRGSAQILKWGLRLIVLAASLYVLAWFIGQTWMVWFPVALALIVATVLEPPTRWLRKLGFPDVVAAITTMLTFLLAIFLVFSVLIPQVADEAPSIANSAVSGLNEIEGWLKEGPFSISDDQINEAISSAQDWIRDSAGAISSGVFSTLASVGTFLINFVLTLILTFLFIKDGYRFMPWLNSLTGARAGRHIVASMSRAWNTVGGFIRTQAVVSAIDAVFIGIGLLVLDVPLAIPLAILVFFGGFIPIVGAFATGALAVLVTLVTNGFTDAIWVLIIIIVVQQVEGNILSPWLQGKSMNLHAAVVLMAVTLGSTQFGITGAFLAVPVVAGVAEIFRYFNEQVDIRAVDEAEVEAKYGIPPALEDNELVKEQEAEAEAAADSDSEDSAESAER